MAATAKQRDEAHQHHMATGCEGVPDQVREHILSVAHDLATHESREELQGVIEAAYALVGEWENFLEGGDGDA